MNFKNYQSIRNNKINTKIVEIQREHKRKN